MKQNFPSLKGFLSAGGFSLRLVLAGLACSTGMASAANWDGDAKTPNWADAANWNPDGVPGSVGNTEERAEIIAQNDGVYAVSLTSDITKGGLKTIVVTTTGTAESSASLDIGAGAVLGDALLSIDQISHGNSSVTMSGGTWKQSSSGAGLFIGRILKPTSADTVSRFLMKGGTYTNANPYSAGRLEIGHASNLNTAIFEMSGGTFEIASAVRFQGESTGNSELKISGGTFKSATLDMNLGTGNGFDALLQVNGDAATIDAGNVAFFKNPANTQGIATVEFVFNKSGVSKITAQTLDLGEDEAQKGRLSVDVTALVSDGKKGFPLFEYKTLDNGRFGSVSVKCGAVELKPGKQEALGMNEYALSYGTTANDSIQLFFKVNPQTAKQVAPKKAP